MKQEKKVGLAAVSNHNYGSQLQTYAMHKALLNLGVDNEIIKYKQKTLKQLKRAANPSFLVMKGKSVSKNLVCKIKYPEISQGLKVRSEKFEEFKKNNCCYSPFISSRETLEEYVKQYCAVILGSDQVWHPANLEMDYFTLNFVPDNIPKITYAPSFGVSVVPENQIKRTKSYISRLDYISVREKAGAKIIKELTGKDVPVVCDPTALLTRKQWDQVRSSKRYTNDKYIFCYFLGSNQRHREFADKVKKLTGYKIVALQFMDEFVKSDLDFGDITPYDVGPQDFINLIANAEIVLTDSFHGTMFSIYYHKNFFTFSRFDENEKESTNSRIDSILSMMGLENRKLKAAEDAGICLKEAADWTSVDIRLSEFRNKSLMFLKNIISDLDLGQEFSNGNTVEEKKKHECTGCTACMNSCPKKCITMKEDEEGFRYPFIDRSLCVSCGICQKVCPVGKKLERDFDTRAFAARNVNPKVRMSSSSGGMFTALASYVLERKGIVVGAGYNDKMQVVHMAAAKSEQVEKLRASKYVQSSLGNIFFQIRETLNKGTYVLFCGTPCQTAGLMSYLKQDYENLLAADVLCYGVPSPMVFEKFLKFLSEKHHSKVTSFYFRDKTYGYSSPNVKAVFDNGEQEEMTSDVKSYTKTFFQGITTRPSCFDCKFKSVKKSCDFTLGDFWTIGDIDKSMDDDTGATLVFVHSSKALKVLKSLKHVKIKEIDIQTAVKNCGPMLLNSAKPNPRRNVFFKAIRHKSYQECVKIYAPDSAKNKAANFFKPIMLKTGITKSGVLKIVKRAKINSEKRSS